MRILIEHFEEDDDICEIVEEWTREITVNDLDDFLYDYIIEAEGTDNRVIFDNYYRYSYVDIYYNKSFTFILRDGKYIWNVPVEEVTVREFINTHDIEDNGTIRLTVQSVIGGGGVCNYVNEIVTWVPLIVCAGLNYAGYYYTGEVLLKKGRRLYNSLIGKNNKVSSVYDAEEMIKTRDCWSLHDLKRRTDLSNESLELILLKLGYIKDGSNYRAPENREKPWNYELANDSEIKELSNRIWGDCDRIDEGDIRLGEVVHELNYRMTSLLYQSDRYKVDSYNRMIAIIDNIVAEWGEVFHRGEGLRFIELTSEYYNQEEELLIVLENTISELCDYVSIICEKIDKMCQVEGNISG